MTNPNPKLTLLKFELAYDEHYKQYPTSEYNVITQRQYDALPWYLAFAKIHEPIEFHYCSSLWYTHFTTIQELKLDHNEAFQAILEGKKSLESLPQNLTNEQKMNLFLDDETLGHAACKRQDLLEIAKELLLKNGETDQTLNWIINTRLYDEQDMDDFCIQPMMNILIPNYCPHITNPLVSKDIFIPDLTIPSKKNKTVVQYAEPVETITKDNNPPQKKFTSDITISREINENLAIKKD